MTKMLSLLVVLVTLVIVGMSVWLGLRVTWVGIKMIRTAWARAAPGRRTRVVAALLGGALVGVVVWGSIIWAIVSKAPWR